MSEEIPPKMTRDSREPHEGVSQTTVQTGEKDGTPENLPNDSSIPPEQVTETEEKTEETDGIPEKVPEGSRDVPEQPKSALSLDQLMTTGAKKTPTTVEEIPDYLYTQGSKQHAAARIIVFEGIEDNKRIGDHVGLAPKTISNVRSAIRKVAKEMFDARERNSGKPRERGRIDAQELGTGTEEGSGIPSIPPASIEPHGTHGPSRTPGTPESRVTPVSLEPPKSDQDLVPAKDVVMVSYPLSDGTPFYFPARK